MELKPRFKVVLYKEANEFLSCLDEKTARKIKDNIYKASLCLDSELFKKLTGDIWEFRTQYNGKRYRMLAFWDKQNGENTLVIVTHGFVKKVSKVPQKEIEKTKAIMNLYINSK